LKVILLREGREGTEREERGKGQKGEKGRVRETSPPIEISGYATARL